MALNLEQLKQLAKTEDLKSIASLKLEGLNLASCFHLLLQEVGVTLLFLSLKNNSLTEIDIPLGFTNLRKLDLSTNYLSSIGSIDLWSTMPRLKILYLHDNLLESWDTFTCLTQLTTIVHITLFNNPCIHLPQYRKFLITSLPSLMALDFHLATQEERVGILTPDPEKSKIWIQDITDMRSFRLHLYKLRRKWEKCSPVIKIQSLWRRYYVRKHMGGHMSERDRQAIIIQKHVRGWLLRLRLRRDLENLLKATDNEHLLYTPEQYVLFRAVKVIERCWSEYVVKRNYKRKRYRASTKISSSFRKWKTSRYGLPILQSTKIYVLKSQQRTLICLLRAMAAYNPELYHPANSIFDRMAPEFFETQAKKTEGFSFPELFNRIAECRSIKMIRFPDIENLPYSSTPLLQMIKWVTHAKVLNSNYDKKLSGLSIPKTYCSPQELEKLKKFRIRGSIISQEERKKYKSLKLNLDDYLDLVEFTAPSLAFVQELFLMILEYNRLVFKKDLPIFQPIFKVLLDRIKAACTIQTCWRGYRVRKYNLIAKLAIERRAVFCIQRWWRSLRFLHRMKFLIKLKLYLKDFTSPIVYMQEHLFQYLTASTSSFMFLEQNFGFYCTGDTIFVTQINRKRFLPEWVGCNCRVELSGGFMVSEEEKTLQAVVLSGARVDIVSLHGEVAEKAPVADSNIKLIKLEYKNVEEAKRRAAVLYLKTLDHKTASYAPLFTKELLTHQFLMSKLRRIWLQRNINPVDSCPALEILSKALNPVQELIRIPNQAVVEEAPLPQIIESSSPLIKTHEIIESESDESEIIKHSVTSQELLKQRVKYAKGEMQRRHAELKLSKQIELEIKMDVFREAKEHNMEILTFRKNIEEKELELKRSFIEAQNRKRQNFINEKLFIMQFAQAKNMIGKLMKNSEVERFKAKASQDIKEKVSNFKQRSKDRRDLVQAILYEKFRNSKRGTL